MAHRPPSKRVTPRQRLSIFKRDKWRCGYCGLVYKDPDKLNADHIIPVTPYGGESVATNLVTACHTCNKKHGNKVLGDKGSPALKWFANKRLKHQPRCRTISKSKTGKGFVLRRPVF